MEFLGMAPLQILTIAIVALIVLGPEKLPQYARKAGKYIRQFRKITSGLTDEISKALDIDDLDEGEKSVRSELREISRSLEEDAASLRRSLEGGASSLEKTVSDSARGVRDTLSKESAAISDALNEDVKNAKRSLSEGASSSGKGMSGGAAGPAAESGTSTSSGHTSPNAMVDYKPPPLTDGAEERWNWDNSDQA